MKRDLKPVQGNTKIVEPLVKSILPTKGGVSLPNLNQQTIHADINKNLKSIFWELAANIKVSNVYWILWFIAVI